MAVPIEIFLLGCFKILLPAIKQEVLIYVYYTSATARVKDVDGTVKLAPNRPASVSIGCHAWTRLCPCRQA